MKDLGADPALAKAEPVARLGPSGFDPGDLRRGDVKLLKRILETNGGGVEFDDWFARYVPLAQERRLLNLGLIRRKPNHAGFFIHTDKTKRALAPTDTRSAKT